MNILQLSKKFPCPTNDGETMAVMHLSRALHRLGVRQTLLVMSTAKHPASPETVARYAGEMAHYEAVKVVEVDTAVRPLAALRSMAGKGSYNIERFEQDEYRRALVELLRAHTYDVVQLETLYLAPYIADIRAHSRAKIVLRSHNVEYEIWERLAHNGSPLSPKTWYFRLLATRLRRYETAKLAQPRATGYDAIAAITARDAEQFAALGSVAPVMTLPIGLNLASYPEPLPYPTVPSIGFIGSLDWLPNTEGLEWFLEHIWAEALRRHPNLTFHIAGRHTPPHFLRLRLPNVVVHGEVPSATGFILSHAISIAPLLSGGGMKVKVLEALALGRTVIASPVGLEGIEPPDRVAVLSATTRQEWLEAIDHAVQHYTTTLPDIGNAARRFVEQRFDNAVIAQQYLAQLRALVAEA